MKCKECKAKIPDNSKYCRDCGALINDIRYDISKMNNYSPSAQNQTYPSVHNSFEQKQSSSQINKKTASYDPKFERLKSSAVILIVIIAIGLVATLVFSIADFSIDFTDNEDIFGEDLFVEEDIIPSSYADAVISYYNNIYDCDAYQFEEDFISHTAIDWAELYGNLYIGEAASGFSTEINYSDGTQLMSYRISEGFDKLNSQYPDDFVPYFFYIDTVLSVEIADADKHNAYDIIEKYISAAGLDAEEFIDFSLITEMYEVQVSITCENEECDYVFDIGTGVATVVLYDGEYMVLYDDIFIDGLLNSL